jgi:Fe-S cluster biogenesis protein NfuA
VSRPQQGPDHTEAGARVEQLIATLRARGGDRLADIGEDLVRTLVDLYGAGLARVVDVLRDDEPAGPLILDRLTRDPLVEGLLLLHGLHPVDVDTRIQQALDRVRPYLGSHAGGVEYLGIDADGVARLRLQGTCHGCASSAITAEHTIQAAVEEAAPEVCGVSIEGVAAAPPGPQPIELLRCPPGMAS